MSEYSIKEGLNEEIISDFFQVPKNIYSKNDFRLKVSEDNISKEFLEKDPFFRNGEKTIVITYDALKKPSSRIVLFHKPSKDDFIEESSGYFAYFDSINDNEAVDKLFDKVNEWFNLRNIKHMYGPMSPKITDLRGILVEGFDKYPSIGMPHNKKYYHELLINNNFSKVMGLNEFVTKLKPPYKRLSLIRKIASKKLNDITIRYIDLNNIDEELKKIVDFYNFAWKDNWAFTPIDLEELIYSTKEIIPFLKLSRIIEINNEIIAFAMIIPDFNYISCIDNNVDIEKLNKYRIYFIGVHPKYRKYGITSILLDDLLNNISVEHNIETYNVGWMLDNNKKALNISFKLGGIENIYNKKYNIYKKDIQYEK